MPGRCKYTLVGKFINAMPKMEAIRKSFIAQTQLTGGVKIAYFNSRHIYIDLDNEADHISVWTKQKMYIAGQSMKLQMWTPTFKPAEETPIVPIWITLPELPWHCHYMDILTPLLSPIGKALYLDSATMQKTSGSVAKVRVQIDITRERPQHVWLGFSEKDPNLGKWQIIEYEDVPSYCLYCKHHGHVIGECSLKEKDEEIKKNKDQEAAKKKQNNTNNKSNKDEQWQVQTKKKNKHHQQNQEQGKEFYHQVQKQQANNIKEQQKLQQAGMTSNSLMYVDEKSGDQISTPPSPVIVDVDDHCDDNDIPVPVSPLVVAAEVIGGRLDVQEKTFNLQEGVTRGRVVNQAPATTPNDTPHHQSKVHQTEEKGRDIPNQQVHISKDCVNQPKGSMAMDMGNNAGTSNQIHTPKSKNKSSKKKRESTKRKQAEQQHQELAPKDSHLEENPCKDFIMMDQIMDVAPLKAKYATPTPKKPPDQSKVTARDEYEVDNSEDEIDADQLPINDQDEDDEISESLIKAFSPNNDNGFEKELQHVTNTQGLSPRGIHLTRLPLKQPVSPIPVTADNSQINMFKSMLAMDHATSNINGKIWLFWNTDIICTVLETDEQQVTCEISHTEIQGTYIKTFVYAKCKDYLRRPLWDRLLHISDTRDTTPWCTVGDFNVITDIDEKFGGIPYNMRKSLEFIGVIEACGLMDLGFNGPKFTWSNQRGVNFRIWKRLDRAMVNDTWLQNMPHTSITHLPSVGSDHCPLLLEMKARPDNCIKYFRFLNFWVEQPSFIETVSACWNRPVEGNPMWTFHQKIKRLASTLSAWSKIQFGDIYSKS
ncbi:hypothetical protein MTR67_039015 [Solanum verrucosum]|uniref:DUF4283 domain-containing protein n=1 Tax=Solanum verrucosum TaxID=315347 RepID=A0AAF0UH35_SOLVR|nr:hypothetical protein MTR67_039015 [Solanum verrucosum]